MSMTIVFLLGLVAAYFLLRTESSGGTGERGQVPQGDPNSILSSVPSSDHRFVQWLLERAAQETGVALMSDGAAVRRIVDAAASLKAELEFSESAELELLFLAADTTGPKHLHLVVTREEIDRLGLFA